MTEEPSRAAWLPRARSHLRNADPVLARLIDERPDFDPRAWMSQLPRMDLFGALLFQVTGQQLSVPATRRTLARIQALFGGRRSWPSPRNGGPTGAWRPATCSPPHSSQPKHHRSPGPGAPDGGQAVALGNQESDTTVTLSGGHWASETMFRMAVVPRAQSSSD